MRRNSDRPRLTNPFDSLSVGSASGPILALFSRAAERLLNLLAFALTALGGEVGVEILRCRGFRFGFGGCGDGVNNLDLSGMYLLGASTAFFGFTGAGAGLTVLGFGAFGAARLEAAGRRLLSPNGEGFALGAGEAGFGWGSGEGDRLRSTRLSVRGAPGFLAGGGFLDVSAARSSAFGRDFGGGGLSPTLLELEERLDIDKDLGFCGKLGLPGIAGLLAGGAGFLGGGRIDAALLSRGFADGVGFRRLALCGLAAKAGFGFADAIFGFCAATEGFLPPMDGLLPGGSGRAGDGLEVRTWLLFDGGGGRLF